MNLDVAVKKMFGLSAIALALSGAGYVENHLNANNQTQADEVGLPFFNMAYAEDSKSWESKAFNWVAANGLKFSGSKVISALGLKSQPEYMEQLNELIKATAEINDSLYTVNDNLTDIKGDLEAIFNLMIENKYDDSAAFFQNVFLGQDVVWAAFENSVSTLSNEEIVANRKVLEALRKNVFSEGNLTKLSEDSAKLSGLGPTEEDVDFLSKFLEVRKKYRNSLILPPKRGEKGDDPIPKIDESNEELMLSFIKTAVHLQRIYAIEALGLYLQANADFMDEGYRDFYSSLVIKERGVSINFDFDKNMENLNLAYSKKFDKLISLLIAEGNIISDENDFFVIEEDREDKPYLTSKKYLSESLPAGAWQQEATLYSWSGVIDSEQSVSGYYDGVKLKAHINASSDQNSFSEIDIDNCHNKDDVIVTKTNPPYLECNYLDVDKFVSTRSTDDIFGFTVWVQGKSPNREDDYAISDYKVVFNKNRVYIPDSKGKAEAIDKDGEIYFTRHGVENKIIQYNFDNAERALFQFSTTHHKKFGQHAYEEIGVGCGKSKAVDSRWSCGQEDANENRKRAGGHSALTLTSKSGKKVRVFLGGRGTEKNEKIADRHAYLDTCVKNFGRCGEPDGDHQ